MKVFAVKERDVGDVSRRPEPEGSVRSDNQSVSKGNPYFQREEASLLAPKDDLPVLAFKSAADFEAWLEQHHASSKGIWLKFAKKGSGVESITRAEAVELALCFGWIDSQTASLDDTYWLQKYTPRRPKSKWSQVNRKTAEALIAQGRMRPAGLKEVEAAKSDGRWDAAYASPKNMAVPEDLQQKLAENPRAQAFFATLDSRNRYAILYRIQDAKRPETRARRIDQFVAMLSEHKTIYPR